MALPPESAAALRVGSSRGSSTPRPRVRRVWRTFPWRETSPHHCVGDVRTAVLKACHNWAARHGGCPLIAAVHRGAARPLRCANESLRGRRLSLRQRCLLALSSVHQPARVAAASRSCQNVVRRRPLRRGPSRRRRVSARDRGRGGSVAGAVAVAARASRRGRRTARPARGHDGPRIAVDPSAAVFSSRLVRRRLADAVAPRARGVVPSTNVERAGAGRAHGLAAATEARAVGLR